MLPISPNSLAQAISGSNQVAPATSAKSKPVETPEQEKLKKAAGDFESILLSSMWKSMKQSFGDTDESNADPASGTINDWGIEVMSGAVGKAGGLGIGNMILKHLEPKASDEGTGNAASTPNVLGKLADRTL
jgi:Rod binding domain-containing protein